ESTALPEQVLTGGNEARRLSTKTLALGHEPDSILSEHRPSRSRVVGVDRSTRPAAPDRREMPGDHRVADCAIMRPDSVSSMEEVHERYEDHGPEPDGLSAEGGQEAAGAASVDARGQDRLSGRLPLRRLRRLPQADAGVVRRAHAGCADGVQAD